MSSATDLPFPAHVKMPSSAVVRACRRSPPCTFAHPACEELPPSPRPSTLSRQVAARALRVTDDGERPGWILHALQGDMLCCAMVLDHKPCPLMVLSGQARPRNYRAVSVRWGPALRSRVMLTAMYSRTSMAAFSPSMQTP